MVIWTLEGGNTMHKVVFTVGNGLDKEFILKHNLQTMDILFSTRENKLPANIVYPDIASVDENTVKVSFGSAPAEAEYVVTIIG